MFKSITARFRDAIGNTRGNTAGAVAIAIFAVTIGAMMLFTNFTTVASSAAGTRQNSIVDAVNQRQAQYLNDLNSGSTPSPGSVCFTGDIYCVSVTGVATAGAVTTVTFQATNSVNTSAPEVTQTRTFTARAVSNIVGFDSNGNAIWGTPTSYTDQFKTLNVSAPSTANCATDTAGANYCWGPNGSTGGLGVGDTSTAQFTTPQLLGGPGSTVPTLHGFVNGTSVAGSTCALDDNGTAWCWGANMYDSLGNGTTTASAVPIKVGSNSYSQIVGTGGTFCGLTGAGAAWCWGYNVRGSVGNGTTTTPTQPAAVSGSHTFSQLYQPANAGDTFCGIDTSSNGFCWGNNSNSAIGNNTVTNATVPTAASGSHKWSYLQSNASDTCGIDTSGAGFCWGVNSYGQLGIGGTATTTVKIPTAVAGSHKWSSIYLGTTTTCGIDTAGAAWCWGYNGTTQVGNGTTTQSIFTPAAVSGSHQFSNLLLGSSSTCGVDTAGAAWCWGSNQNGQIGNGVAGTANYSVPASVKVPAGQTFTSLMGAMDTKVCGLANDGVIYCWGDGSDGGQGDGSTQNNNSPTPISSPTITSTPTSYSTNGYGR